MSARSAIRRLLMQEDLNFLLTNRIPRHALTRFMGWFSKIEHPLIRAPSIALWQFFCDVDLTEAEKPRFASLHDAFTRALKPGMRRIDPDRSVLVSPCDAILGASGRVEDGQAFQIKGFRYSLADLLGEADIAGEFEGGRFVTLRLTAGMYHRFHAPHDLTVDRVRYIAGDTWNVNPVALKRVERLFCKNERAPIAARLPGGERMMIVPVAAVLVSSIRMPFLDAELSVRQRGGLWQGNARFAKGEEIGWFEHGSTIILLVPKEFTLAQERAEGDIISMGTPLMRLPCADRSETKCLGELREIRR